MASLLCGLKKAERGPLTSPTRCRAGSILVSPASSGGGNWIGQFAFWQESHNSDVKPCQGDLRNTAGGPGSQFLLDPYPHSLYLKFIVVFVFWNYWCHTWQVVTSGQILFLGRGGPACLPPPWWGLKGFGGFAPRGRCPAQRWCPGSPLVANWYHSEAAALVIPIIFVTLGFPAGRLQDVVLKWRWVAWSSRICPYASPTFLGL